MDFNSKLLSIKYCESLIVSISQIHIYISHIHDSLVYYG